MRDPAKIAKAICDRMTYLGGTEVGMDARATIEDYLRAGASPGHVERAFRRKIVKISGVHVHTKANRTTGTETMVVVGSQIEAGDPDAKWAALCITHSTCVTTTTLQAARDCASDPTEFCDECRGEN
jgi:hypothetical protein